MSGGKLRYQILEKIRWLAKPKIFWLTIAVIGVAGVLLFNFSSGEAHIRWLGLALQLLGMGTVAWGFRELRLLYGMPGFLRLIEEWLEQRKENQEGVHLDLTMHEGAGMQANIELSVRPGSDESIESRLDFLLETTEIVKQRLRRVERELNSSLIAVERKIEFEERSRVQVVRELDLKMRASVVGGLHVSVMGLIWLIFGVVLSALSIDMAKFL